MSHTLLRFLRVLPGVEHIARGNWKIGALVLCGFLVFPLLIAVHFQKVVSGIISFFMSLILLGLDPDLKARILRPELMEHWVAALFALSAPAMIWYLDRKYIKRTSDGDDRERSQLEISWNAFVHQKSAVAGLVIIAALYSIAFLCPYIAPMDPNEFQDGVVTQFKPPLSTSIALREKEQPMNGGPGKGFILKTEYPEMYASLMRIDKVLLQRRNEHVRYVDAFRIEQDRVIATAGRERIEIRIATLVDPDPAKFATERLHILGTDSYGRDILSRIIYGSRISLSLGFIAVLLSVVLGTVIGLSAGYFGGKTDSIIMRCVDVLLAFPSLFLILIFIAVFEKTEAPRILLVVIILGLTTWMGVARLVRAEVLSLKERDFILAAKALGLSHVRILFRHLLPNAMTPIVVNATLRIGGIILLEAALSFLNLGVQQPTASWGNIIYEGKDFLVTAWWITTLPGLAIVLTVVSFNLVGDGLRDALDPMLKNS